MYPPPQGPTETPEQAQELDDTFLASDPFSYFTARIGMLHAWALAAPDPDEDSKTIEPESVNESNLNVIRAVMSNQTPPYLPRMTVSAQVAVDAFALRHHLAEALLRLFVECVEHTTHTPTVKPGDSVSIWARMSEVKLTAINDLVKAAASASKTITAEQFAELLLPPDVALDDATTPLANDLLAMCGQWLSHACDLLRPGQLDVTTAHNKVKHGLAVRGRSDLKVTFSTVGPNENGDTPLSAFDPSVSVDIFERPVLEFLARPKVPNEPKQGLEVTQLRLGYRELLSEASMLAFVYGALFHVSAHRHFRGRDLPELHTIAAHPGFVGATPAPNHAGHQVGLRFPITTPPGGSPARPAIITTPDGMYQELKFGSRFSSRVVAADPESNAENSDDPTPEVHEDDEGAQAESG